MDAGRTSLPQRNRFVNLPCPGPLLPVAVCALFTCLPKISATSEERIKIVRATGLSSAFLCFPLRAFNNENVAPRG